ncbi:MAG: HlyD family efflux transporter periplasmic adaptor subunit [Parvularculaceae bacterium]
MSKRIAIILAALLLAACGAKKPDTLIGYAEADYLYLGAQDPGVVKTLSVSEGDKVAAGAALFRLDTARATLNVDEATARAASAAAQSADNGALDQQVKEAEAALALAEQTFNRSAKLLKDGYVTRARYDADAANLKAAKARLDAARAQRTAGQGQSQSATAAAALAEKRRADMEVTAPDAGTIERIYHRPGEVVGAGEPVVALLPPKNIKIKFFAAQAMLPNLDVGKEISFTCDGCSTPRSAKVSYIATEPQFTPPVIYSLEERSKLVFLVEARPEDPTGIRPGLPVTIEPIK